MSITIRLATQDDRLSVQTIERQCFGAIGLWQRLGRADTRAWIALDGEGHTVGYAIVFPRRLGLGGYGAAAPYVGEVGVLPKARRNGAGRALMLAVLAHYERAWLHVRADNIAAVGLYRSLGFAIIGRHRRFYHDGAEALVMAWFKNHPWFIVGLKNSLELADAGP